MESRSYDLVVVGGGIYGSCVAWEAASRGLSVALLERGDFAQATSSNSYKIAHGGIRYLQHGDIPRVRESSRERSALLRIAPHQVYPLPILIPTYGHGVKGKGLLRLGFAAYRALTPRRNRGINRDRRIPRARFLSRADALREFPDLPEEGLTGGVVFHDGQMYSPPRLVLSFLHSAVEAGADVINYAEVTRILRDGPRVVGVEAHDLIGGQRLEIRGALVVNAAGPWAAELVERDLKVPFADTRPSFSRDIGLVTRRRLHPELGLACPTVTHDAEAILDRGGRHLFLLPWREYTLVGVWHGLYTGGADRVEVGERELLQLVADVNRAYPGLRLDPEDVTMVISGLILFGDQAQDDEGHSFGKRSLIVDHGREHGLAGLLSVVGVRATTARGVAEEAVDRAFRALGRRSPPSMTARTPIRGGDFESFDTLLAEIAATAPQLSPASRLALAHNHGDRFRTLLRYAEEERLAETLGSSSTLQVEVIHAVREEMAQTLMDVAIRRTDLGTAESPDQVALETCAELLAVELGWDDARLARELKEAESFFRGRGAVRDFVPPASVAV